MCQPIRNSGWIQSGHDWRNRQLECSMSAWYNISKVWCDYWINQRTDATIFKHQVYEVYQTYGLDQTTHAIKRENEMQKKWWKGIYWEITEYKERHVLSWVRPLALLTLSWLEVGTLTRGDREEKVVFHLSCLLQIAKSVRKTLATPINLHPAGGWVFEHPPWVFCE